MIEAYTRFLLRLKPTEPFHAEYVAVAVTITLVTAVVAASLIIWLRAPLSACRVAW